MKVIPFEKAMLSPLTLEDNPSTSKKCWKTHCEIARIRSRASLYQSRLLEQKDWIS